MLFACVDANGRPIAPVIGQKPAIRREQVGVYFFGAKIGAGEEPRIHWLPPQFGATLETAADGVRVRISRGRAPADHRFMLVIDKPFRKPAPRTTPKLGA